jgi:hypothetical protein
VVTVDEKMELWKKLLRLRWHQYARIVAVTVLLDQALGPVTSIPQSEGVVLACIAALFAPVPAEKKE